MSHVREGSRWRRGAIVTLAVLLAAVAVAPAAEPGLAQTSLHLVPDDAAFYTAMLRNREQVEAVLHSRAWAKLRGLPGVQMLWQMAQQQLKQPGPHTQFLQLYQRPENRELVELLKDMASEEVFCYGGSQTNVMLELASELSMAVRFESLAVQIPGGAADEARKAMVRNLLNTLQEHPERLRMPELVIGFRVSDAARAERQLKRLDQLAHHFAAQQPLLKGRVKKEKVGDGHFTVLTLDGSQIPLDQVPIKEIEDKPGEYDKLLEKIKGLKLSLAVGLRGPYLLVALGESTAPLAKLGAGKLLADRPELQPLTKFADRPITSVSFASKAFNAQVGLGPRDLERWSREARRLLKKVDLPDELRERLQKDVNELTGDLKSAVGEPGPSLSFTFLTERGQEGYAYDWSKHAGSAEARPLTLLEHVGGSPILAILGRTHCAAAYPVLVKWAKKINGYVDEFVLPQLPDQQKEQIEQVTKIADPLLRRLDAATTKMLIPGLADGQKGLVLDARLTAKKWFPEMPEAAQPLPLPEPALLVGVSDAGLVRRAFAEYRAAINEAIGKVRELAPPGTIPDAVTVPAPETRKVKGGTLYYYPIKGIHGLDERILPNAGLSAKVAVLALTEDASERLMARTPFKPDSRPLGDASRPLYLAAYFDWARLVDTVRPWAHYVGQLAAKDAGEGEQAGPVSVKQIMPQVDVLLDVLKCLHNFSACSYEEGGATVTHSEVVYKDL